MAILPTLSHFKTPTNPHPHLLPQNANPHFLLLRSSTRPLTPIRCSSTSAAAASGGGGGFEPLHPRPAEIPWSKDLANSVRLIGNVGAPVQIKHLSSGKVFAWSQLAVKISATDTTWINLTFWDELALVAFQHVEKGQQVYVSGRLVSNTVEGEGEEEKPRVYYKVVVQELNFIEKSMPRVSLYEGETNYGNSGAKFGDFAGNRGGGSSTEELWQAFFANPVDWWDNRMNKRNPKAPDFKHKDTGEALWVEGKYNPPWVKSQLAILDSRMGSLQPNGTRPSTTLMLGDDFSAF